MHLMHTDTRCQHVKVWQSICIAFTRYRFLLCIVCICIFNEAPLLVQRVHRARQYGKWSLKKTQLSCEVCVVCQPDAGLPFSRVFLEARFSAVTSQRSKRLPRTSHIVQSYLAHTEHRGKTLSVSGEQQLITQRYLCPCL